MDEHVQIAITRWVRPGCEAEFQQALREFIQASFAHSGVLGAGMFVPLPGSDSREYGVLRTFQSEQERDDFYKSPLFKAWQERVKPLTEGEPVYRKLHGLEAWFRNTGQPNPPQWKMALVTYIGVDVVTTLLLRVLGPLIQNWPFFIRNSAFNVAVVACLTWLAMPLLTRGFRRWLQPESGIIPMNKT
jgi:antibiotic biosynthesis monooxygenase (ABM) superfamily enzyme